MKCVIISSNDILTYKMEHSISNLKLILFFASANHYVFHF